MKRILVVGTADTKGAELAFLADRIRRLGGEPVVVDIGTRQPTMVPDIAAATVAGYGAPGLLEMTDRGEAIAEMGRAFAAFIEAATVQFDAILGIGGSGGTSVVTAGMRRLPIGLPKVQVSTLASGDVAPYVGTSDITMMPAITDLAGLNRISRTVLAGAAAAVVGMANRAPEPPGDRPAIGLTMFGVTTPCVTAVTALLANEVEPLVFHATGTGGKTLEALVDAGLIEGVIDITTTEVCDLLVGGVLSAGEDRFGAIARTGVPCVLSVGALDMVNFWAMETVPEQFRGRNLYRHNPNVTLMRTTAAECERIGAWIAGRLNAGTGPLRILIPEKGVSALDIEGGAFFDPEADAVLFDTLEAGFRASANRTLKRLPFHINDPKFAEAVVAAWHEIGTRN